MFARASYQRTNGRTRANRRPGPRDESITRREGVRHIRVLGGRLRDTPPGAYERTCSLVRVTSARTGEHERTAGPARETNRSRAGRGCGTLGSLEGAYVTHPPEPTSEHVRSCELPAHERANTSEPPARPARRIDHAPGGGAAH